jgi:superfamily I DNA/RNA helicase
MELTSERIWSPYQQAIFRAVAEQHNSLIIEAVAGSGKTTTIVEAINHVPREQSVCFLAFNKSIASELKNRIIAKNAICMTLHSAGFGAWRRHCFPEDVQVNSRKCSDIAMEIIKARGEYKKFGSTIKLVSIAKNSAIVPQGVPGRQVGELADDRALWEDLIDFYGLDPDECDIDLAKEVLVESIKRAHQDVDFDDMLYMPIIEDAPFEKYDVIFLDEAQDVSEIQVEMVSRMRFAKDGVYVKPDSIERIYKQSRVIAVGDSHQAIYGFRGALCDSMEDIQKRFDCESLPLSVSYRCPQEVVKHVQQWVPHIEWFETAPAGLLEEIIPEWKLQDFRIGDSVLCRVTRPVVDLAFRLIRAKIPAKVIGRDIGSNLIKLIEKMKATDMVDLDQKLLKYRNREAKRPKMDESKLAALDDKIATIHVFMDELGPDGQVADLIASINQLFGEAQDGSRMVTLSTVHKAKGLEWPRVFILDADLYMPSRWAREPWQRQQEKNLMYVAATRAKAELRYISSEGLQ